jgi:hypothetical protein
MSSLTNPRVYSGSIKIGQYVIANVHGYPHGGYQPRMCRVVDSPRGLRLSVYNRTNNTFRAIGLCPEGYDLELSSEAGFEAFKNGTPLSKCKAGK